MHLFLWQKMKFFNLNIFYRKIILIQFYSCFKREIQLQTFSVKENSVFCVCSFPIPIVHKINFLGYGITEV